MAAFKLPDTGVLLDCHPMTTGSLPQQAFAISLSDGVIEDMIRCVQGGQGVELATGSNPSFSYGAKTIPVSPTPDTFLFDLFTTNPQQSVRKAAKYPNPTMGILKNTGLKNGSTRIVNVPVQKTSRATAPKTTTGKAGKPNKNLLNQTTALSAAKPRSSTASPSLSAISPSLGPMSISQQAVVRAKEQRLPIVHELAVRDQTEEHLLKKWTGAKNDFRPALEKAADLKLESGAWSLKKNIWKELDVYSYDYESHEDRKLAIENAVKIYDRIRLAVSDPIWQRLLPVEKRGKGVVLSTVQAGIIAKGPNQQGQAPQPPKITLQKPQNASQESGASTDDSRSKGTNVFNGGGKAPSKKATATKARGKTTSKVVPKNNTGKEKRQALSQAYVTNSDDDGSENEPLSQVRPLSTSTANASKMSKTLSPKPRASPSMPSLPPKAAIGAGATKRGREEDDSISSSGAPSSKRRQATKEPSSSVIRAPINKIASSTAAAKKQNRSTPSSAGSSAPLPKAVKGTSPNKSSPLASSPPTNASDLEGDGETPPPPPAPRYAAPQRQSRIATTASTAAKKRPIPDEEDRNGRTKKPRVSSAVLATAHKFKTFYGKYETLHNELADLDNPPEEKVADLVALRKRLEAWKKEIYQGVGERE